LSGLCDFTLGAKLHFEIQATGDRAQPLEESSQVWQELLGIFQNGDLKIRTSHQLALGVSHTMRGSRSGPIVNHSHFAKNIPLAELSENDGFGVITDGDVHFAFQNSIGFETAIPLLKNDISGFKSGRFHLWKK
jgi:hypothetical protein